MVLIPWVPFRKKREGFGQTRRLTCSSRAHAGPETYTQAQVYGVLTVLQFMLEIPRCLTFISELHRLLPFGLAVPVSRRRFADGMFTLACDDITSLAPFLQNCSFVKPSAFFSGSTALLGSEPVACTTLGAEIAEIIFCSRW